VIEASDGRIGVFGGLGGQYFLEELQRGSVGIMTGFAFPEVLIGIYRRFTQGDEAGAERLFHATIDLMRYEFQPNIGLAMRKHVYRRRGVYETEVCRPPAAALTDLDRAELERVVQRCGLRLGPGAVELPA
jgi:4-hydroxy-tetrahydrodipicolinate synthase